MELFSGKGSQLSPFHCQMIQDKKKKKKKVIYLSTQRMQMTKTIGRKCKHSVNVNKLFLILFTLL